MSQGPAAPEYGTVAPTLASALCHAGTPLGQDSDGDAVTTSKTSGSPLAVALAQYPRTEDEIVPAQFAGPLTLTVDQWNEVALINGAASTTGLLPGGVYQMWTTGLLNTGTGLAGAGDILWVLGVALTTTTMLIRPCAFAKAN